MSAASAGATVVVIPSRYGSTRFPGKPLVPIAGKSLISRVWERVIKARIPAGVWVATDDSRIEQHVREIGGRVVMTPGDCATGTDRIAAAIDAIRDEMGREPAYVINVQGDEPLIDPELIDRIASTLESSGADVVTLACPLGAPDELDRPDVVKVVTDLESYALYFSRSPIPHGNTQAARRHIGVYGFRSEVLRRFTELLPSPLERSEKLEQLRLLQNGFKILVLETDRPHQGVDQPEDVARVERALESE